MQLQFLCNEADRVLRKFQRADQLEAEYHRRTANEYLKNVLACRAWSLYCVYKQRKGIGGADLSALILTKYDTRQNCFEEAIKVETGGITHFGIVMRQNKIYILGGYEDGRFLKSVSILLKLLN